MKPASHHPTKHSQNIYLEGKKQFASFNPFFVVHVKWFKWTGVKTRASTCYETRISHIGCTEIIDKTKPKQAKNSPKPYCLLELHLQQITTLLRTCFGHRKLSHLFHVEGVMLLIVVNEAIHQHLLNVCGVLSHTVVPHVIFSTTLSKVASRPTCKWGNRFWDVRLPKVTLLQGSEGPTWESDATVNDVQSPSPWEVGE